MITATQIRDGQAYMRNHLSANDYYSESETVMGYWHGKLSEMMGINGQKVTPEVFEALRTNRHPLTGEKLTPRKPKVAYHDFVVSAPKSVSIAAMVGGDDRVVEAFDRCVENAFKRLESEACVRVRKGQAVHTENVRKTGNAVAAVYRHDTSRLLDPQLHSHLVFANVTWDEESSRWLALQPKGMAEQSQVIRQRFYRELSSECWRLGYRTEADGEGFRLKDIDRALEKSFSQRAVQREAFVERYREIFGRSPDKKRTEQFIKEGKTAATRRFKDEYVARFEGAPTPEVIGTFVQDWRSSKMSKAEPEEVRRLQESRMTSAQSKELIETVGSLLAKSATSTPSHLDPPQEVQPNSNAVDPKQKLVSAPQSKTYEAVVPNKPRPESTQVALRRIKKMMKVQASMRAHPTKLMALRLQQLARKQNHGTQRRIR